MPATDASGLLAAYLGGDAGRRVHAGAVGAARLRLSAPWCGTRISAASRQSRTRPGLIVIELINAIFETLTASLRARGGQVLKFLGDGMLATFPFVDATRDTTCSEALDAAADAMAGLDRLNAARQAGKPMAAVDLALHLGEVLYGNVGAVDRLDFTVIGPAVNEAARIETLCEPLGRRCSSPPSLPRWSATAAVSNRSATTICAACATKEIYGLVLGSKA